MHEILSKRDKVAATFMAMLLAITFIATFLPKATATPTLTINIYPISGNVGTEVEVNGTIDTFNGNYTIRWNETFNVTTGYATGYNITTSFVIPQTIGAPSGRDVLIELIDNTVGNSVNTTFTIYTKFNVDAVAPSPPSQLQEGRIIDILVNVTGGEANTVYSANITVTDPSGAVYYNDALQLTNTTNTGYSEGNMMYPTNFSLGANTDYVGLYTIALNETLATENFTVGLTDRLKYGRTEIEVASVLIRGAGYPAEQTVVVNVTFAEESVGGYPKYIAAGADGVVTSNWTIPNNATLGIYTVTLTDVAGMHVKPVPDIQNFTVTELIVYCQTQNRYDNKPLADVSVAAYLDETYYIVSSGITNETGWVDLQVSYGNYTFKAFWRTVEVGSLKYNVLENATIIPLECELAYLTITIKDEASFPLPFINVTLASNKTGVLQFETDNTGIIRSSMFTNASCTIEARRYGLLFSTTQIANLTVNRLINITFPTYSMLVNVLDSKGIPLRNVEVKVYEWTSGVAEPVQSETTDDLGSAVFHLTFGKYRIWVYNTEHTIILNKTVVDLTEDQLLFVVHCKIFNVDLSVIVEDYFGQPISKAMVEVKGDNGSVFYPKTVSKGTYSFYNLTGGDCQISVSVMDTVSETRTFYLDEAKVVVFKLEKFVVVGGFLLEITQLIAYVSLGIVITLFSLALIYRRLRLRKLPKKEKEKSL